MVTGQQTCNGSPEKSKRGPGVARDPPNRRKGPSNRRRPALTQRDRAAKHDDLVP